MKSHAPLVLAGILGAAALALAACGGGGAAATATAAPGVGDPERGKALIVSQGCAGCHAISSVPGAAGQVGPKLDGIGTEGATLKPGMSAAQYIEESIRQPDAYIMQGFQKGVMPRLPLSDQQVRDLVAFLLTLN